jgi:hypothetical protein
MKAICIFTLLLFLPVCQADDDAGKVCLHISERGTETAIIQNNCKKGDIITLHKRLVAYLCDFNKAVINYDGREQYLCAFLGAPRELQAGTNP